MAIFASTLSAARYRNFTSYELTLDEGLTVLVGRNAAGKTNLIEALQLLTAGRSFRKSAPADLVQAGETSSSLSLSLKGEGRVIDMGCAVNEGKRSFTRNGKRCRANGVRGVLPSVLFCPDDLNMVKRGARFRREALDGFGVQLNESYAQLASAYDRAVEQRNSLLKEPFCSRDLLAAWNESIAATAAALTVHRLALLARVRGHMIEAYASLAAGEHADIIYTPSWATEPLSLDGGSLSFNGNGSESGEIPTNHSELGGNPSGQSTSPAMLSGQSRSVALPSERSKQIEFVRKHMLEAFDARANEELRRGITLVGPHRDDISFMVNGLDARSFASQGQQRSLVLAWKVAEVDVTRDILGRPPLLLLDDVMSELDENRRSAFLEHIEDEVQTVITTTNLGYFTQDTLERAKVVTVDGRA